MERKSDFAVVPICGRQGGTEAFHYIVSSDASLKHLHIGASISNFAALQVTGTQLCCEL